jgi:hypothetical protein
MLLARFFVRQSKCGVLLAAIVLQCAARGARRMLHFDSPEQAGCGVVNLTVLGAALITLEGVVQADQGPGDYYLLYGPGLTDFRHGAAAPEGRLSITFRFAAKSDRRVQLEDVHTRTVDTHFSRVRLHDETPGDSARAAAEQRAERLERRRDNMAPSQHSNADDAAATEPGLPVPPPSPPKPSPTPSPPPPALPPLAQLTAAAQMGGHDGWLVWLARMWNKLWHMMHGNTSTQSKASAAGKRLCVRKGPSHQYEKVTKRLYATLQSYEHPIYLGRYEALDEASDAASRFFREVDDSAASDAVHVSQLAAGLRAEARIAMHRHNSPLPGLEAAAGGHVALFIKWKMPPSLQPKRKYLGSYASVADARTGLDAFLAEAHQGFDAGKSAAAGEALPKKSWTREGGVVLGTPHALAHVQPSDSVCTGIAVQSMCAQKGAQDGLLSSQGSASCPGWYEDRKSLLFHFEGKRCANR